MTIEDVHFEIGRIADKEKIQEPSILKEVERLEKIAKKITKNNQKPYILEFLGLEEETKYSEEQLETRILDHLQQFLLELGKGFTFVGRQVRFTFEEEHFRVDLVFYNRLLRSFVVIDLKLSKLSHKDLGQMQMYVNYYDRKVKLEDENPTIGILLCQSKNDAVVEMTLPKDTNIFASAYSLYLPDKKLLQEKLAEWIAEFEE
jgi:predicted nuclease of restriction endonuclease-like (RecB) superfamily